MKKKNDKSRQLDVRRSLAHRSQIRVSCFESDAEIGLEKHWKSVNSWIDKEKDKGLSIRLCSKHQNSTRNSIVVSLPSNMNFNDNYDDTVRCIGGIRRLVSIYDKFKGKKIPKKAYKLGGVDFDGLTNISTSAALVLTAEMSKWDCSIRNKLKPDVENWKESIFSHFDQLGFFDLFDNKHNGRSCCSKINPDIDYIKYVKVKVGSRSEATEKKKFIKDEFYRIVGSAIPMWTILHSGLSEAVTNVTHHAYPRLDEYDNPAWYLTGSYNKKNKEIKVVFYDQGIGIPNSLPASKIWEKILDYTNKYGLILSNIAGKKKDAVLLKAAVSIDRTSTSSNDRGKGLQDLLEFIRMRKEGYMSIMSYCGLYKYELKNGVENIISEDFNLPIKGTLITWCARL